MLKLENVVKRFGSHTVLDDVTVDFPANSVNFLVGPNGAGKTTLIRCVLGLLGHGGRITWNGDLIDPSARLLCPVFDDAPVHPGLTGAQNIAVLAPGSADGPVSYLTPQVLNRRAKSYSHGERMRLALTMALNSGAELVILDEPTNGLDRESMDRLRSDLMQLRSTTTFLVTGHNLEFYEDVVDAIFVLKDGAVSRWEPPRPTPGRPKEARLVQAYHEHFQTARC